MNKTFAVVEVKTLTDEQSEAGSGSFEAILSAPTLDRDGEVIDARAFEPLPDRIPIHADHVMTTAGLVGSAQPYYEGDVLKVRGTFASTPAAQQVRTLLAEGHLRSMSVGFMAATRSVVDDVPHITKGEILEGSFVPVPSNRQATVLAVKALDPAESFSSTDPPEHVVDPAAELQTSQADEAAEPTATDVAAEPTADDAEEIALRSAVLQMRARTYIPPARS